MSGRLGELLHRHEQTNNQPPGVCVGFDGGSTCSPGQLRLKWFISDGSWCEPIPCGFLPLHHLL